MPEYEVIIAKTFMILKFLSGRGGGVAVPIILSTPSNTYMYSMTVYTSPGCVSWRAYIINNIFPSQRVM